MSSYLKLELYNLLKKLGAEERDARAAAEGYLPSKDIATKADLAQLKTELMQFTQDMGWKIGGVVGGLVGIPVSIVIALIAYLK